MYSRFNDYMRSDLMRIATPFNRLRYNPIGQLMEGRSVEGRTSMRAQPLYAFVSPSLSTCVASTNNFMVS